MCRLRAVHRLILRLLQGGPPHPKRRMGLRSADAFVQRLRCASLRLPLLPQSALVSAIRMGRQAKGAAGCSSRPLRRPAGCHELIRSAGCSARTAWFKHGCCAVVSCSIVCFARALASQRDSVDAHRVLRPQPRAAPITRACEGLSDSRHDTYYKLGSRHAREGNRSADSTIIIATIIIRSCPASPFINPHNWLSQ